MSTLNKIFVYLVAMNLQNKTFDVVRFDDKLVYHGSYYLSPRAIKTLCYLIARYVDPEKDSRLPMDLIVPIAEIAQALVDGTGRETYKSIYSEIDSVCDELTGSRIRFNSKISVQGIKLRGYINWCSSAIPMTDEEGRACMKFHFDPLVAQFFLGLSQYVRLYRPEVNRLQSGHAIRLFQMLKGIRNKRNKYEKVSRAQYDVQDLKFLFGVPDNYPQFKDFNKRVLKPSIEEINEQTTISILELNKIRDNRRITALEFVFTDQESEVLIPNWYKGQEDYVPSEDDVASLTRAQYEAYQMLLEFGIKAGIALRQLLPSIHGSEFVGYEDWFVKYALEHFRRWSNQQATKDLSAATFVTWWHDKGIFGIESDVWPKILEKVVAGKKQLQSKNPEAFSNRQTAATMTRQEFIDWYKSQREE